jgi:signal transduction histidine kinase
VTQKLRGKISLESQLGVGATFIMIFPISAAEGVG